VIGAVSLFVCLGGSPIIFIMTPYIPEYGSCEGQDELSAAKKQKCAKKN
jgi:hypothetical protein